MLSSYWEVSFSKEKEKNRGIRLGGAGKRLACGEVGVDVTVSLTVEILGVRAT